MIPWQEIGRARIPNEDAPLILARRGHEFVIRIGARALMSSLAHGSEQALAERACAGIARRANPRVLIGGLGMGFTLAAALASLPAAARVTVAELIPEVIEWNKGPLAPLAGSPLGDTRVTVHAGDVAALYRDQKSAWDAILLDVDNGPHALTHPGNHRLYHSEGLRAAFKALRSGGVFGVWSVAEDEAFTRRLGKAGFTVEQHLVRARRTKGGKHTLWLATKPGDATGT